MRKRTDRAACSGRAKEDDPRRVNSTRSKSKEKKEDDWLTRYIAISRGCRRACWKVNSRSTLREPARGTGRGKVAERVVGRGCTRGDTRGREWAMVVAGLQTQKKRDEKEGREGEGRVEHKDTTLRCAASWTWRGREISRGWNSW